MKMLLILTLLIASPALADNKPQPPWIPQPPAPRIDIENDLTNSADAGSDASSTSSVTESSRLNFLIGGSGGTPAGTAPCTRSTRSVLFVGGKQKPDDWCKAQYELEAERAESQAEHERTMARAYLALETLRIEAEIEARRDEIRLESLKLEQCVECEVLK